MSKERARRREVREREAAIRAEARARDLEREARLRARRNAVRRRLRPVLGPLLPGGSTGRQTGILAQRRRVRLNLILTSLVMVQVIVWVVSSDWQARLGALIVSLLAFPVIAAFAL